MTYRQLLKKLQSMPDASLDDTVTVFNNDDEEFYPVDRAKIADDDCDVLDEGHLYLTIN
jgi:hypothetical protein